MRETSSRPSDIFVVQVSISYIHFILIGQTRRYPRLSDQQYYKFMGDKWRSLGPKDVLEIPQR